MLTEKNMEHFLDLKWISEWRVKKPYIWQMKLLDSKGLANYSQKKGLHFSEKDIQNLWKLGLLKADLVQSTKKVNLKRLSEVGKNKFGYFLYSDDYNLPRKSKGWLGAAFNLRPIKKGLKLLFHPFRYYMLYEINRIQSIDHYSMPMLYYSEIYEKATRWDIAHFRRWSRKTDFRENINKWTSYTNLAIAAEFPFYSSVIGRISYHSNDSSELQREIDKYWKQLRPKLSKISLQHAIDIHQHFCFDAELLDGNKQLHTLLRLTRGKSRLELKGKLGGSLVLITMAEFVRRAFERMHKIQFKEEDDAGFGVAPQNYKESTYGSNRLLDGDEDARREFIRQFGLLTGARARWYVEGATEYGILKTALDDYNVIEFINLDGQFAETGGKGLAFRRSLRSDIKSGRLSFISLDGDRADYVRMVKKAAEEEQFLGGFFISQPDIEYANFTPAELEEIIWSYAVKRGAKNRDRNILIKAITGAEDANELEERARKSIPALLNFSKGYGWGEALLKYALKKPNIIDSTTNKLKLRPMIAAMQYALELASGRDFQYYKTNKRVNPDTGVLEKRK